MCMPHEHKGQKHLHYQSGPIPNFPFPVHNGILQRLERITNAVERTAPVPECFSMKNTTLGTWMERIIAVTAGNETAERQWRAHTLTMSSWRLADDMRKTYQQEKLIREPA